jgi:hypothetical protein
LFCNGTYLQFPSNFFSTRPQTVVLLGERLAIILRFSGSAGHQDMKYHSIHNPICTYQHAEVLRYYFSIEFTDWTTKFHILSIYLWFYSPCRPWLLFQYLNLYTVHRTTWTGDQPVARPLLIHRTTQTQNKRSQISIPLVGFEPTVPAFRRVKTVHALYRAAAVIGTNFHSTR